MHCRLLRIIWRTSLHPQLPSVHLLKTHDIVAFWAFCITVRAEALSNAEGDTIKQQPARGKSTLKAQDSSESVSQLQDGGDSRPTSQGKPPILHHTTKAYKFSGFHGHGSPPNTSTSTACAQPHNEFGQEFWVHEYYHVLR